MIEVVIDGNERAIVCCEAILFDMDGTLVDSRGCVESVWRAWAARHGVDANGLLGWAHGRQNHDVVGRFAPHLELERELVALTAAEEACRDGIAAVPGARELLLGLDGERWAIVTSAWKTLADIRLACAGLPLPEVLITADDVSLGKPDPAPYLAAAARLDVPPSACLVFEDAHAGVEAALAAGMTTVALGTTYPAERLGCRWWIDDFRSVSIQRRVGGG